MTQRIRDRLHNRDTIESRMERLRKANQTGVYTDEFTTVPLEPWQVTLARLPKCLQKQERRRPNERISSV